jgi:hypothetical protein
MLKFIFYFFGVVAVLYEIWSIGNWDAIKALHDKIDKLSKKQKDVKITPSESLLAILHLLYFVWVLVGLFSSQWEAFGFILILSLLNHWLKGRYWNKVDAVLTVAALLFAILNTYHFHINPLRELYQLYFG